MIYRVWLLTVLFVVIGVVFLGIYMRYGILTLSPQSCQIVAHRGVSFHYPENTLIAFHAAIGAADMIEFDLRVSKDHQFVIMHDKTVNRTTNGRGRVASLTLKEIKKLDAGSWFALQFAGEKVPTLIEVLELACGKIAVNIEIKYELPPPQEASNQFFEQLHKVTARYAATTDIIFSSFDHDIMRMLKQHNPAAVTFLLFQRSTLRNIAKRIPEGLAAYIIAHQASGASFDKSILTKEFVQELKNEGLTVGVFTVDTPRHARRFFSWGVDIIFSNRPKKLSYKLFHRS